MSKEGVSLAGRDDRPGQCLHAQPSGLNGTSYITRKALPTALGTGCTTPPLCELCVHEAAPRKIRTARHCRPASRRRESRPSVRVRCVLHPTNPARARTRCRKRQCIWHAVPSTSPSRASRVPAFAATAARRRLCARPGAAAAPAARGWRARS